MVTTTYRPSVREDIRANALDPPRIQNPGLKLCLMPGVSVCASPRGRRSLLSTSSNGSWVPPSRLPSRTRPTRPHGCTTNLRDKRFETPFKLQQRVFATPLCPAFDQHRQNNKAILRGLRAKVYSAEPHNKGQICSRKPYWAWNEAEWQSHGVFVQYFVVAKTSSRG